MNMRERCERAEAYRKNGGQLRPGAAGGIRRCDGYYGDPGTGCRCGVRRRRAKREHLRRGKRAGDDPGLRVSGNGRQQGEICGDHQGIPAAVYGEI